MQGAHGRHETNRFGGATKLCHRTANLGAGCGQGGCPLLHWCWFGHGTIHSLNFTRLHCLYGRKYFGHCHIVMPRVYTQHGTYIRLEDLFM